MKYILAIFGLLSVGAGMLFFRTKPSNDEYVRIHISANSSTAKDENIKYFVKDVVVEYLADILCDAKSEGDALEILKQNFGNIKKVVDASIKKCDADYECEIGLKLEDLPTRKYDDLLLESGEYQTLDITLGEGKGENWWCVVFPTVCFISPKNSQNFVYISKIWEIINNVI